MVFWGGLGYGFLHLCNAQDEADLPAIWSTIISLSTELVQAPMEFAYHAAANRMRFRAPRILHSAAFMVLALAFYTKYLNGVGDSLNVFLFTDLSPSVVYEEALPTCRWDATLVKNTFTSFYNTASLIAR